MTTTPNPTAHHYAVRTLSLPGSNPDRSGMVDPGWTPALPWADALAYLERLGVSSYGAALALTGAHTVAGVLETPDTASGLAVWADDRGIPGALWRVSYLNPLDGRRHVLLGGLDRETAHGIRARFADRSNPAEYLPETAVEPDDGTADGALIGTTDA